MGNPRDHAARDILSKFSILLPLRAVYFRSYHYETPCIKAIESKPQTLLSIDSLYKRGNVINLETQWGEPFCPDN